MTEEFTFGGDIAWRPAAALVQDSRIHRFMTRHDIPTYDALLQRSTADIAWFWEAVLAELGIEFYQPYRQIVDLSRGLGAGASTRRARSAGGRRRRHRGGHRRRGGGDVAV